MPVERRDVVIVGAGPAGTATAIALARADPTRAADVLLLDKAVHPRPKTCAGGVIPKALRILRDLDVGLTVPNVRVDRARVFSTDAIIDVPGQDLCRVIRRDEFDASLVAAARERGAEVREATAVRDVRRAGGRICIETDRGAIDARVVVGADGSGSVVRRRLVGPGGVVARAVMQDVPLADADWDGAAAGRYEFDFRACPDGLRGYGWAFPCLIDGRPHANVGAYGLPPVDGPLLRDAMTDERERVGAPFPGGWKAFPIHTYDGGQPVAAENVLLVGDAAGADALLGEGISFALEYGCLAAEAIARPGPLDPAWYQRAVDRGPVGRKLAWLAWFARRFYGPRGRSWFRLAQLSRRAQRVGLGWYNGLEQYEGRSRWELAAALFHPAASER